MEVDDQPSPSTSTARKPGQPTRLQVTTVRLLKPPITIATKLCRIIGELLSLMVKFCVNPARPRRHAVGARGEVPSGHARSVATTISALMSQVINMKGPLPNPPVRFRLNYLICVLTFIQPLLFDEKRFAYHFMLQKFVSVGTIDAFFGAFRTVMRGSTGVRGAFFELSIN
jgi:E3 ubiquitin-protein ligase HUWE1